jgi:hypothetical protein
MAGPALPCPIPYPRCPDRTGCPGAPPAPAPLAIQAGMLGCDVGRRLGACLWVGIWRADFAPCFSLGAGFAIFSRSLCHVADFASATLSVPPHLRRDFGTAPHEFRSGRRSGLRAAVLSGSSLRQSGDGFEPPFYPPVCERKRLCLGGRRDLGRRTHPVSRMNVGACVWTRRRFHRDRLPRIADPSSGL